MQLNYTTPTEREFEQICNYIHEFELDNRELKKEEFCSAFRDQLLLGFGRLRKHSDCIELCSLGVIPSYRNQGIGKAITAELIRKTPNPIYLVCIIPSFFKPFGYREITTYPSAIQQKIDYCNQSLPVPEPYVAMCLNR
ncbi:MAG TPA: GNAT family N-acetyltransferase [Bacteroidia bacterium]|nr:GNAT family N-acetyltransferase [Bacteroidia bacterium]